MITTLIFDLDDTLYNNGQITVNGRKEACQAIAEDLGKDWMEVWERIQELFWKNPNFKEVYKKYFDELMIPKDKQEEVIQKARKAYMSTDTSHIVPFEGVPELLTKLKEKYTLFILSTGIEHQQLRKINALGIQDFFTEIIIDDDTNSDKTMHIKNILEKYKLTPGQAVMIGDRIDKDISCGKEAGVRTIHMKQGKYAHLTPQNSNQEADATLEDLREIKHVLKQWNSQS
jgi:putative hydrolase of the HAD superfamily